MRLALSQSFSLVARFLRAAEGTTAIEYAVIGALVACGIIAGALLLGTDLNQMYSGFAGDVPAVN